VSNIVFDNKFFILASFTCSWVVAYHKWGYWSEETKALFVAGTITLLIIVIGLIKEGTCPDQTNK
jgi:hypothetical protein